MAISAARREGSSREQILQQGTFNSLFSFFSELDQFTDLALVGVMSKECVAPVPNLGFILH